MRIARRLATTVAAALAAGALTAGCDNVQSPPAITKEQAVERVEARAQEAFQRLPAGATLKPRSSEPEMPCDDGPGDRTFVENDYTIDYPTGWPVEQTIPTLADYWAGQGYRTVKDERTRDRIPAFSAEHPDGFRIGVRLTYRDNGRIDAFLISSSPCR
jgi:hypothetical protein